MYDAKIEEPLDKKVAFQDAEDNTQKLFESDKIIFSRKDVLDPKENGQISTPTMLKKTASDHVNVLNFTAQSEK